MCCRLLLAIARVCCVVVMLGATGREALAGGSEVCCDQSTGACSVTLPCPPGTTPIAAGSCMPDPCTVLQGACCDVGTGACTLTYAAACTAPLVFEFPTSTCGTVVCRGACCADATGACMLTASVQCASMPGVFLSTITTCSPDPCAPLSGACCFPVGIGGCQVLLPAGCAYYNGDFHGVGSTCSPVNPCAGACCNSMDSTCIVTGSQICANNIPGGMYHGDGSTCTPNPCGPNACCNTTTGQCSVVAASTSCPAGTVLASPATLACSPQPCPQPTACCDTTSGACSVALPGAACAAGSVAASPSGTSCTAVQCPQPTACCNFITGACSVTSPGASCPADTIPGIPATSACTAMLCPQPNACCNSSTGACFVQTPGLICPSGSTLADPHSSSCTGVVCPQPMACCDTTTGACTIAPAGTACGMGTVAASPASVSCTPDPCPKGACCDMIGGCVISSPTGCATSYRGDGSTCGTGTCVGACCLITGECGTLSPGACVGSFRGLGTSCLPANPCPQPVCCNEITGQCALAVNGACAAGSLLVGNVFTCSPSPCLANVGLACADCTYINGPFDGRDGQASHLGGAVPLGTKAADDFFLEEDSAYDLRTFSATLFTTTFPGLVKPKGEIWSDCDGCPGMLLYTFENPLVVETGATFGNAPDGRPLRVVNVTFDVTRETNIANRNVVLRGGRYWLSIYGVSDNLGASMGMFDITYWGTTAGPVKGKPAYKINGVPGAAYGQYNFLNTCGPTGWHSVAEDCCIGCTDLNFSVCTNPCKMLIDNGGARAQVGAAANGSTSQFAPGTASAIETRSADDFVVPPCRDVRICYVEACVLTNCAAFDGVFELYANDCHKPDYALHGTPLFGQQFTATKVVPLGAAFDSTIDGRTVHAYKLEFHDLNIVLPGGRQYWISVGVRSTFSLNERAYFCYNQRCDRACLIQWNDGRVLTAATLDDDAAQRGCVSPAPVGGCNGWARTGNDFSFLIAADGVGSAGPVSGNPGGAAPCAADSNRDGTVDVNDIFDYLTTWFGGCP